jgi:hypothetical protein
MMSLSAVVKWACFTAVVTLVACAGDSPQLQPMNVGGGGAAHPFRAPSARRSWMKPEAAGQRLLYVSDSRNKVVYVYGTSNTLEGTLTGFAEPLGECVDASNNVWVVDYEYQELYEYAHGGTKPIAYISTGDGNPYSCSVDPTTGDIAIGIQNFTSAPGWITICAGPSHCTNYLHSPVSYVYFLSYDKNGNLYVDGTDKNNNAFVMAVRSGGQFQKMTIKGAPINFPGALVNKFGVLSLGQGASGTSTIYQIAPDGTVIGSTQLSHSNDCNQFAINGNARYARITCPNLGGNVTKYKYPAGGKPIVTLSGPFGIPFAAVYSNP